MGQINSSASRVLIWLGAGNEAYSRTISKFLRDFNWNSDSYLSWFIDKDNDFRFEAIEGLTAFCEDQYRSRALIVHECVLATNLELQCGTNHLTDEMDDRLISDLYWPPQRDKRDSKQRSSAFGRGQKPYDPFQLAGDVDKQQSIRANKGDIAEKILEARNARQRRNVSVHASRCLKPRTAGWPKLGCSDINDRIYSLLALMPTGSKGRIVPDCSISPAELSLQVIERVLSR